VTVVPIVTVRFAGEKAILEIVTELDDDGGGVLLYPEPYPLLFPQEVNKPKNMNPSKIPAMCPLIFIQLFSRGYVLSEDNVAL
jgi:hypothetical protein